MRIPKHIAIIPDGNRRWAKNKGFDKHEGYTYGLEPAVCSLNLCKKYGVKEVTYYGFTTDNCKRPKAQVEAFATACVDAVKLIEDKEVSLLVVGNTKSALFPEELLPYTTRTNPNEENFTRVNILVNYGWEWDLSGLNQDATSRKTIQGAIKSHDVSRIDLIIRLGGRCRLSGLLPIQSVYSDIFCLDDMWPDFCDEHFEKALQWYNTQDITLGG
ncbi:MAG: di-trans,poly-cis-decaprenylcistransferase [Epulopiscium sp. Nele67-Bin005]|nr:MAG: di-trans,poly-cis-decaprenylcistransferase [Epulopiscium sp. Nele67-Bin005]